MADMTAAFLRALLLMRRWGLAVQLLPPSRPTTGSAQSDAGGQPAGGQLVGHGTQQSQVQQKQRLTPAPPASAEAALALLTAGAGGVGSGGSGGHFGVRAALHTAAGAAVSGSARLMGVGAGVIGSTAHLVGSTAQAVSGSGGVMGATAGLVSGTAHLVSSAAAATRAAAAAAAAGPGAPSPGENALCAPPLTGAAEFALPDAQAEATVTSVVRELLASAADLADPVIAQAEATLQLLPDDCKARTLPAGGGRTEGRWKMGRQQGYPVVTHKLSEQRQGGKRRKQAGIVLLLLRV